MNKYKLLANLYPLINIIGCFLIFILSNNHTDYNILITALMLFTIGMIIGLLAFGNLLKVYLGSRKTFQKVIFGISWVLFGAALIIALLSHKITYISGINIHINIAESFKFFFSGSCLMWVYLYLKKSETE